MNLYRDFVVGVLAATMIAGCQLHEEEEEFTEAQAELTFQQEFDYRVSLRLLALRFFTRKYRNQARLAPNGFEFGINGIIKTCVQHPTDGGMGYHYANQERFDNPEVNWYEPEVMLYEPDGYGGERLAAVEWVVPKAAWEAAGNVDPPVILGQEMTILNPALNWYVMHAWVWDYNPAGTLSNWNPDVVCP